KIVAKPDVALITVSVVTQDADANKVQSDNNTKMATIVDFLKKNGIKEEDIQTSAYSLNPQYDYTWCHKSSKDYTPCPPKIIGYTLTQTVSVKIRDFTKINTIVGGLTNAGANEISNISFTIDDPENYKNQARIEALNKIKERAQLLSRETNIKIGRILNITESGYTPRYYEADLKAAAGNAPTASVPAPIEVGTQDITVNLTVTYEIK
ncbi:MAG: SIMPL domain-containing protein, partial [Parcubacteria group bacterium]|nr:SIMPL domain-containing protein [Parcubacteria group bacterium]